MITRGGRFIFFPGTPKQIIIPNNVLSAGRELFLKQVFQADSSVSDFYLGLMGSAFADDTTLADILASSEPTIGTGGYARAKLTRNTTDWPTVQQVNGEWQVRSKLVTFTASGADFDTSVSRAFLCDISAGSSGNLLAVSGALPAAMTIADGESLPVIYENWYM